MDKGLCALLRQESSNASNVSYMIKGRLTNGCHLFLCIYCIYFLFLFLFILFLEVIYLGKPKSGAPQFFPYCMAFTDKIKSMLGLESGL